MKVRKCLLTYVGPLNSGHLWNLAKSQLGPGLFPLLPLLSTSPPTALALPQQPYYMYVHLFLHFYLYLGVPHWMLLLMLSPPCLGDVAAFCEYPFYFRRSYIHIPYLFHPSLAQQHAFFMLQHHSCCCHHGHSSKCLFSF